jgi:hypothetical protein
MVSEDTAPTLKAVCTVFFEGDIMDYEAVMEFRLASVDSSLYRDRERKCPSWKIWRQKAFAVSPSPSV